MCNLNYLQIKLDSITKKEIEKLKESYLRDKNIDKYIFIYSKNIFRKLVFPYFRFEILLSCIKDIKDNHKYYQNMQDKDVRKVDLIHNKLQKICLYLNIALEEYLNMLSLIEKA